MVRSIPIWHQGCAAGRDHDSGVALGKEDLCYGSPVLVPLEDERHTVLCADVEDFARVGEEMGPKGRASYDRQHWVMEEESLEVPGKTGRPFFEPIPTASGYFARPRWERVHGVEPEEYHAVFVRHVEDLVLMTEELAIAPHGQPREQPLPWSRGADFTITGYAEKGNFQRLQEILRGPKLSKPALIRHVARTHEQVGAEAGDIRSQRVEFSRLNTSAEVEI